MPASMTDPTRRPTERAMERLLTDGVVGRVVYAPTDPEMVRAVYRKWFGAESVETHSANGQQLFATLFGFDSCSGDYVLQMDSDLLIACKDSTHDYLDRDDRRTSARPQGVVRAHEHLSARSCALYARRAQR